METSRATRMRNERWLCFIPVQLSVVSNEACEGLGVACARPSLVQELARGSVCRAGIVGVAGENISTTGTPWVVKLHPGVAGAHSLDSGYHSASTAPVGRSSNPAFRRAAESGRPGPLTVSWSSSMTVNGIDEGADGIQCFACLSSIAVHAGIQI